MRVGVLVALAGAGSVEDRIANALLAKHGSAFDVVIGTPNATELLDAKRREVSAIFMQADEAIEGAICDFLMEAGRDAAADTARLLFRASKGISEYARVRTELETDIKQLVSSVLAA
jgi:hypothetical protein